MKLRDANLETNEKNSFTYPGSCILFSFYENTSRYFFRRVLESVRPQFLSRNIAGLLVIYLFNEDSAKSTFSMLSMQLQVLLSTAFVK